MAVPQRDLVERAARGDHDAFALLVGASVAQLEAAARLILRNHELAGDAVQDAYRRAWRELPGVRDPERFDGWLYRLTINACLDVVRRRTRRPIEVELTSLDPPSGDDSVGRVADRDQLERGFRTLTTEQRAVLVLHHYVGLTMPALADALDIPLGTAQSRLGRALGALRAALRTENAHPGAVARGHIV
jgi:RNA polymerase sigma-70 factor (ECF subfamily)